MRTHRNFDIVKLLKGLVLAIAGLLLLVAIVICLAFVPAIQRGLALHFANQQPGLRLAADRIAVGLHSVEVRNLKLEKDGMVVTAPQAEIKLSLLDAGLHKKIWLESVIAKGWKVELPAASVKAAATSAPVAASKPAVQANPSNVTATSSAKSSQSSAPVSFDGVFKYLVLPVDVRLQSIDVAGEVILPSASATNKPGTVKLTLKGGGFAPGSDAKFDYTVDAAGVAPDSPVAAISTKGTLAVKQNVNGVFEVIVLDATTEANSPSLPAPARLRTAVTLTKTTGGEHYDVSLDLVENSGPQQLVGIKADFKPGTSLSGTWKVRANRDQVGPFAMGRKLPKFLVDGQGTFDLNPTKLSADQLDAHLTGKLLQETGELATIMPELSVLGTVKSELDFDAGVTAGKPSMQKLELKVAAAQPLLEAHLLQRVDFDPNSMAAKFENPTADLLRLQIHGIPLAWAKPFLKGIEVQGNDLRGEFVITPKGEGFVLKTSTPVTVERLSVTQAGQTLLREAKIKISTMVEYSATGTHAQVTSFSFTTADKDFINAQADVTVPAGVNPEIAVNASFDANLPKLVSEFAPVGALKAKGEAKATLKGNLVSVETLAAELSNAEGQRLIELRAQQAFTVDTAKLKLQPKNAGGDVVSLSLGRVPLSMARPFLPPDLVVQGDVIQGDFAVRTEGDSFAVRTLVPFRLTGLGVTQAGKVLLRNVDIEFAPTADYTAKGLKAELASLKISSGSATLLSVKGSVNLPADAKAVKTATVSLDVNLPAVFARRAITTSFSPS